MATSNGVLCVCVTLSLFSQKCSEYWKSAKWNWNKVIFQDEKWVRNCDDSGNAVILFNMLRTTKHGRSL